VAHTCSGALNLNPHPSESEECGTRKIVSRTLGKGCATRPSLQKVGAVPMLKTTFVDLVIIERGGEEFPSLFDLAYCDVY
jgi:hypothetical protein